MLTLVPKSQFRKDFKKLQSLGLKLEKLAEVIHLLQEGKPLDARHRDHTLTGAWKEFRECHIQGDWLLIYQKTAVELVLVRTGSHSELFG